MKRVLFCILLPLPFCILRHWSIRTYKESGNYIRSVTLCKLIWEMPKSSFEAEVFPESHSSQLSQHSAGIQRSLDINLAELERLEVVPR